eukprot:1184262-Prorocentrum_minimum.AAC.1
MLGLEFQSKRGSIELEYFGRRVRVRISPVGVQVDRLRQVNMTNITSLDSFAPVLPWCRVWRGCTIVHLRVREGEFARDGGEIGTEKKRRNPARVLWKQKIKRVRARHPWWGSQADFVGGPKEGT